MGKSHSKGKRFERDVAEWIRQNDGIDEKYATTSTGRLGPNNSLQFDVPGVKYAVECKHRSTVPKWLIEAWEQVIEVAEKEGKHPLLAIKKNYKPVIHCITEERHQELLKYERRVEDD